MKKKIERDRDREKVRKKEWKPHRYFWDGLQRHQVSISYVLLIHSKLYILTIYITSMLYITFCNKYIYLESAYNYYRKIVIKVTIYNI